MRAYILGMRAPLLAALAALPLTMGAAGPVRAAEPGSSFTTLAFTTQVAGLSVMATEADVELDATGYRIDIATRTVGAFGLVMRGETRSLAQGRWAGTMAAALALKPDACIAVWLPLKDLETFDAREFAQALLA